MPTADGTSINYNFHTPKGNVVIEGPVTGQRLSELRMGQGLNNFRPYGRQYEALKTIAQFSESMIFVASHEHEITGYVTFLYPDKYTRWAEHPRVIELGGIEMDRDWRRCNIGSSLLKFSFMKGDWEDYIVITTEYFRHWDMEGNNLSVWDYRKLLDAFFGQAGFVSQPTCDPDILEHPANVLMARFGSRVAYEDKSLFEQIALRPDW